MIFPLILFGIQGMGRIGFEAVAVFMSIYLVHPVSIVLIFLVCTEKIGPGRGRQMAMGFVAFNALCLLALAALIGGGVFRGDSWLPLVFAVPSLLFLLNSWVRTLSDMKQTEQG